MIKNGAEEDFNFLFKHFKDQPLSQEKMMSSMTFAKYLATIKNKEDVRKGVDEIMKFRNQVPEEYRGYIDPGYKNLFSKISAFQKAEGNSDLAGYIDGLL
jgi:aminopeptidase N